LPLINRLFQTTVAEQIKKYGVSARSRLTPKFAKAELSYPPDGVAFVAIKSSRELQVYCSSGSKSNQLVCVYPILGASGHVGPKLRAGDYQVPEGIYSLTLEPNTPYHLALRLNYPNESDLLRAKADGRTNPGRDILMHGTTGSAGCVAMGDQTSEDLFVLVNDAKNKTVPMIITPVDLRLEKPPAAEVSDPNWLPQLHKEIETALKHYPVKAQEISQ